MFHLRSNRLLVASVIDFGIHIWLHTYLPRYIYVCCSLFQNHILYTSSNSYRIPFPPSDHSANTMAEIKQAANNPSSYDHSQYTLEIRLTTNPKEDTDEKPGAWLVILVFHCHDLPQLMQEGLFWTTSNVVPELGYIEQSGKHWVRHWRLRQYPNKAAKESRWLASLKFYHSSYNEAANVPIEQFSRGNVASSRGWNKQAKVIFSYDILDPAINVNCIYPRLQPSFGSWWIWPMGGLEAPPSYSEATRE